MYFVKKFTLGHFFVGDGCYSCNSLLKFRKQCLKKHYLVTFHVT